MHRDVVLRGLELFFQQAEQLTDGKSWRMGHTVPFSGEDDRTRL